MRVVRTRGRAGRGARSRPAGGARPRSATTASSASATSSVRATSRSSCSPTSTERSSRWASASARSSGATRRCSRNRRPRPWTRRSARDERRGGRVRAGDRLPQRGHGRVHGRRHGDFYFLELNGRIQVEHPVTEAVTGVDLVQEQIRIAQGERISPSTPPLDGHAVEVRLYAEDPRRSSRRRAGSSGCAFQRRFGWTPEWRRATRSASAYDPMIAKLIAHGRTREESFERLRNALDETEVEGLDDQPAVPALARRGTPWCARAKRRPLSSPSIPRSRAPPERLADPRLAGAVAAQPPPPAARSRSRLAEARARPRRPAHEQSTVTAPMPGTVIRVLVARGRDRAAAAAARSCSRR